MIYVILRRFSLRKCFMLLKRISRGVFTFGIYLIEFLLLINVIKCLFGSNIKLWPISFLAKLKPIKWIVTDLACYITNIDIIVRGRTLVNPPLGAISDVIKAIGIGNTFITMLTVSAEKLVCGVRTGELLNWAHKFFYQVYALVFLPTVFLGIFSGTRGCWAATFYALLGVLLGMGFTLWTCLELVLLTNWRKKLAIQYYHWKVQPGVVARCLNVYCLLRNESIKKYVGAAEIGEMTRQSMLSAADYLKNQSAEYHQDFSGEMIQFWLDAFWVPLEQGGDYPYISTLNNFISRGGTPRFRLDDIEQSWFQSACAKGIHYPDEYLSDGTDYVVVNTFFARDIWSQLLPGNVLTEQDKVISRRLLNRLCQSKKDTRSLSILLGLLFYLEDRTANESQLITQVADIMESKIASSQANSISEEVRSTLIWSLLMICMVAWIQDGRPCNWNEILALFCRRFRTELNTLWRTTWGTPENEYREHIALWYAEWIARQRRCLPLNRYLLGITAIYGKKNAYTGFPLEELTYRKNFLMDMLCEAKESASYYSIGREDDERNTAAG